MDPNNANDEIDFSTLDRGDNLNGEEVQGLGQAPEAAEEVTTDAEPVVEQPVVAEPAPEPEKVEAPAKPKIQIPKERLDEEIGKRRKLEQELEQMKARLNDIEQRATAPKVDEPPADPKTVVGTQEWFDAQEEAYMDAVLDGDNKKALELRRQIRTAEEAAFEAKVAQRSRQVVKEVDIEQENAQAVDKLEGAFGVFNPQSADYDDDLVNAVLGARVAIMRRDPSITPGKALIAAAAKLGYSLDKVPQRPESEPESEPEPEPEVVEDDPPAAVSPRLSQPPRAPVSSPQKPRTKLTEATISKMSAEELARLRGDIL